MCLSGAGCVGAGFAFDDETPHSFLDLALNRRCRTLCPQPYIIKHLKRNPKPPRPKRLTPGSISLLLQALYRSLNLAVPDKMQGTPIPYSAYSPYYLKGPKDPNKNVLGFRVVAMWLNVWQRIYIHIYIYIYVYVFIIIILGP